MTLPSSGPVSIEDINVELGRAASAAFDMDGIEERDLVGTPSGSYTWSDWHGKSSFGTNTIISVDTVDFIGTVSYGLMPFGLFTFTGTTTAHLTPLTVDGFQLSQIRVESNPAFSTSSFAVILDADTYPDEASRAGVPTNLYVRFQPGGEVHTMIYSGPSSLSWNLSVDKNINLDDHVDYTHVQNLLGQEWKVEMSTTLFT